MLDEFNLKYLKTGKNWWGNKYAFQVGCKFYNPFDIKPVILQFEYNQARPYTYSHKFQLQNYGNLLQPLAHPLGSNFREAIAIVRYGYGKWSVHFRSINSFKGINNSPNENVGGDIYQSNSTFVSFYGNYILQGKRTDHFIQELKVSRSLIPSWNLQAEVTGSYRIIKDGTTRNTFL
ncbi:MAG: hypothetical protein HC905_09920 [Bacteroidales bacterium]|nr:hypothetical protein [Bacteroidales bacterium]